jgi:hypothetical protein
MPRIFSVRCSAQNELKQSAQAIFASIPHISQRCDGHIQRSKLYETKNEKKFFEKFYLRVGERCRNDCPLTLIHFG